MLRGDTRGLLGKLNAMSVDARQIQELVDAMKEGLK